MIGHSQQRIVHATPLAEVVDKSRRVGEKIDEGDYESALDLRGHSFQDQLDLLELLTRSEPKRKSRKETCWW